jgi:hypothetical protein
MAAFLIVPVRTYLLITPSPFNWDWPQWYLFAVWLWSSRLASPSRSLDDWQGYILQMYQKAIWYKHPFLELYSDSWYAILKWLWRNVPKFFVEITTKCRSIRLCVIPVLLAPVNVEPSTTDWHRLQRWLGRDEPLIVTDVTHGRTLAVAANRLNTVDASSGLAYIQHYGCTGVAICIPSAGTVEVAFMEVLTTREPEDRMRQRRLSAQVLYAWIVGLTD